MKPASHKIPGVRTIKFGRATRIVRADFFEAIGIPDPLPEATRPLVMTPKEAERYGFSRSGVDRMIAAGRAGESNQDTAA
jgi:hypothetical protein